MEIRIIPPNKVFFMLQNFNPFNITLALISPEAFFLLYGHFYYFRFRIKKLYLNNSHPEKASNEFAYSELLMNCHERKNQVV